MLESSSTMCQLCGNTETQYRELKWNEVQVTWLTPTYEVRRRKRRQMTESEEYLELTYSCPICELGWACKYVWIITKYVLSCWFTVAGVNWVQFSYSRRDLCRKGQGSATAPFKNNAMWLCLREPSASAQLLTDNLGSVPLTSGGSWPPPE